MSGQINLINIQCNLFHESQFCLLYRLAKSRQKYINHSSQYQKCECKNFEYDFSLKLALKNKLQLHRNQEVYVNTMFK